MHMQIPKNLNNMTLDHHVVKSNIKLVHELYMIAIKAPSHGSICNGIQAQYAKNSTTTSTYTATCIGIRNTYNDTKRIMSRHGIQVHIYCMTP